MHAIAIHWPLIAVLICIGLVLAGYDDYAVGFALGTLIIVMRPRKQK